MRKAALLFILVGVLTSLATASGRVAHAAPRIYRDSVEPHWFDDNGRFWYRNNLRDGAHEFIVVDARNGTREAAFDHPRLATALSQELQDTITAEQLPINSLAFQEDGRIRLEGPKGSWILNLDGYALESEPTNTPPEASSLPFSRRPRPSRRTGEETEIRFQNLREEKVQVHWIDPAGEWRSYVFLEPGQTHAQHTYAGHVWLVTRANDEIVAVFEAVSEPSDAVIDNRAPDVRGRPRERQWRQNNRKDARGGESPNGEWCVEAREHNLWLTAKGQESTQLTTDGSAANTWQRDARRARGIQMRHALADESSAAVEVHWSPDSTYFVAIRTKTAPERHVHLIESSPSDQTQPRLHSYPYLKPGDEIPVQQLGLFNAESGEQIELDNRLFPNPFSISDIRWAADGTHFTFQYNQRGHQVYRVIRVDAATREMVSIVDETCQTFFDYSGKSYLKFLDDSNELIWMSERDGWNHLYLIDAATGEIKSQITKGEWAVRGVDRVDAEKRQVWFRAGGIHPEQDPYHVHYARVDFDGCNLVVLTAGDGTHEVEYSPDAEFLIAKWSRVDCAPVHELRRVSDGSIVCELERADTSELADAGHRLPERFVAKGRDGETDIYGIIHWPHDFDPSTSYPIIENIYAGPHSAHVPKRFGLRYGHQQEIANRGFVVVQIDGMGTSHRSKAFHDVCWRNIADAGFPDRILWIQALAKKYECLDSTRVGIYGGSAGGQNALGALLSHGDFYRVAVADCGCHDNRMDKIWWNELWMGWPVGPHYEQQSNVTNAHRLNGELLLIVGELDRNVDPSSTLQVVNALIKADKDFDFLMVPGGGHGIAESPYGRRRRADFFVEHLRPSQN